MADQQATTADIGSSPYRIQQDSFRLLVSGVALIAGLVHVLFLAMFIWLEVYPLALLNMGSVLLYLIVYSIARDGNSATAWYLTLVEVVAHAVVSVWFLGLGSGFAFYLLLTIPVVVISTIKPLARKIAFVAALSLLCLVVDCAFYHAEPLHVLPVADIALLHHMNVVCTVLSLIFVAAFYNGRIVRAEASLQEMASTDPLTQLQNRRALLQSVHALGLASGRPAEEAMAFVMCDIDHFKNINDAYGHDAGDVVLKAISAVLQSSVRAGDSVARWGGEEFLLVLHGANVRQAMQMAERLRIRIEALRMPGVSEAVDVSMTFGVSVIFPGETAANAIQRADRALYAGKRAGRNRVVLADGPVSAERAPAASHEAIAAH